MYALPLADGSFDLVLLQMVLHYAEEPEAALAEARRVLAPGGRLIVVDLAPHARENLLTQMGHRAPGFSDARMGDLLARAQLLPGEKLSVGQAQDGALRVRIWQGLAPAAVTLEKAFS
jgi:ArsR family transcriptional regulator